MRRRVREQRLDQMSVAHGAAGAEDRRPLGHLRDARAEDPRPRGRLSTHRRTPLRHHSGARSVAVLRSGLRGPARVSRSRVAERRHRGAGRAGVQLGASRERGGRARHRGRRAEAARLRRSPHARDGIQHGRPGRVVSGRHAPGDVSCGDSDVGDAAHDARALARGRAGGAQGDGIRTEWATPLLRTPLYVIHSKADETVPVEPVEDAVRTLKGRGADVTLRLIDDVPHHMVSGVHRFPRGRHALDSSACGTRSRCRRHDPRRVPQTRPRRGRLDCRLPRAGRRAARDGPDRTGRHQGAVAHAPPDAPEPSRPSSPTSTRSSRPGLSHWQHPPFFGYFPCNGTLGERARRLRVAPASACSAWPGSRVRR